MKPIKFLFFMFVFASPIALATGISPKTIVGVITVDVNKANQLFKQGALFVDVRSNSDWGNGRIPDSIHLNLKHAFSKESLLEQALLTDPIVIYCNGEKCLRSSKASIIALKWGFSNIYFFRDGFPAWKLAKFPTE